ncbi:uncharacterized protein [Paramisgurnus dabryanus]|uniref:uncharacterized protein isoform X2 n=1 Tax=Paramisgurnus dabryanus TaxID=90735 RepID=UPI0031F36053
MDLFQILSSDHQKGSDSDLSGDSMKSDGSMEPPLHFRRLRTLSSDRQNRSDSGSSGDSMKSDGSMEPPLHFRRLRTLRLRECNITAEDCIGLSLNLTSNPSHLTLLDLSDNNIGDFGVEFISYGLKNPDCKLLILGLRSCNITAKSCVALTSALTSNPSHLTLLDLSDNNIGDSGVELISDVPRNPDCKLQILRLIRCNITGEGCVALTSALMSNPSHLRDMDLSRNKLTDSGMRLISDVLKNPDCKLEILWLCDCDITDEGCVALSSALRSNPSHLRELNLSGNKLTDSGVKQISDVIKDSHCTLQKMGLWDFNITAEVRFVLTLKPFKAKLILSYNNLGDSEVKVISDELKKPDCKVEELELRECNITDCVALTSALTSNPSHLTLLDLSYNNIEDLGVELISDVLRNPDCKLQILRLQSCNITGEGCAALTSALTSNPSHLRDMDLSRNKLTDSGMRLISDVLKNPDCKLEILWLYDCDITDEGCVALSSALRSNPSHLRELNLSGNKLTDSGVKQISDVIKDSHCTLQKLGLWSYNITKEGRFFRTLEPFKAKLILSNNNLGDSEVKLISDGLKNPDCKVEELELRKCNITDCVALTSALTSNPSHLTLLDLCENNIGDSGLKLISDVLRNPDCKLQILRLVSCNFTAEGCADLSSALTSNPSHLRHLGLSNSNIGDSGVKLVCDVLKNPDCKLEWLELSDCNITDEGCVDLTSALRSNPSHLRELDLSENKLTDSGVKPLCNLMDDPHYKLKKLISVHQKRSDPEPSCVSMKTDLSMDPPVNFKSKDTQPADSSVHQKRSDPEPSCVSMKTDVSMDPPVNFKSKDTHPADSSVHQKRSDPEPSCVSMKTDVSMDPPVNFKSKDTQPADSSVHQKRSDPEPSCVSMKTDVSMDPPVHFKSKDTQPADSSVHQKRSDPEPSCVSMKTDVSMDPQVNFKSEDTQPADSSVHQKRSDPEPSCVSMKTDLSMDPPVHFKSKDTQPADSSVHQKRSDPEPSCVSMKTDVSMDPPVHFKSKDTHPADSSVHQKRSDPEPSCVSMKTDLSMDPPVHFKSEDTQPAHSSVHQKRSDPEPSCVSMKTDVSMDPPVHFKSEDTQPADRRIRTEPDCKKTTTTEQSENQPQDFTENMSPDFSHDSNPAEVLNKFRSNLRKKFECLCEVTSKQGNPTLLNEIYTELYITESNSGEINNEHEVTQIETQSRRRTTTTKETSIKCNDIFKPLPKKHKHIRSVLTKGVAGIGKTVSVQKFILVWAEEKENQDVHLIFPLPFREINLMKDKTLSLLDLLHLFFPETKEMEIFSDEYKVLFIFDGLDEYRLSLDFHSSLRLCDVSESTSVAVMLTNLIKGNLCPSALIWITSRPAAADLIPSECVDRVTEVRGFSDPQKEEYFRKRISDKSLSDQIISHLKSSRSLYIMCHIPVFCWISGTVLERILSEAERREIPKTLTQMYTHFLIIQTNIKHQKDYENKVKDEDLILNLGELAFKQLVKNNLIFYDEDLRDCGIDVSEASVYSGLCTQIFREELGLYQGKVYSFVHLTIQEHLAALYAHISFINNNTPLFFENCSLTTNFSKVHQKAVDEALQSKNGHLDLFLRFLLGLSVESNQKLIRDLITQMTDHSSHSNEETIKYIKQKISEDLSTEKFINLFHCLNELGDHSLMEEVQHYLKSKTICKTKLSSSQWSAVVFVLLTSEQKFEEFRLADFIQGRKQTLKELQQLLPVICESRLVQMIARGIMNEYLVALTSALKSNPSHLRDLNLSETPFGVSGMKMISDVLKNPQCKLGRLSLWNCNITAEGCDALTSALKSNPSHIKYLDLSHNHFGDSGVKLISDVLKNPDCKLETLKLSNCNITEEGCDALTSALRSNPSHLIHLDMTMNDLGDSVMKLIFEVKKNPHRKLQELKFSKPVPVQQS